MSRTVGTEGAGWDPDFGKNRSKTFSFKISWITTFCQKSSREQIIVFSHLKASKSNTKSEKLQSGITCQSAVNYESKKSKKVKSVKEISNSIPITANKLLDK